MKEPNLKGARTFKPHNISIINERKHTKTKGGELTSHIGEKEVSWSNTNLAPLISNIGTEFNFWLNMIRKN